MSAITSQITSLTIVYSTIYSGADQLKHQSSASLAFVRGIHRGPVNSTHKGPVTRKVFPFGDVIRVCCDRNIPGEPSQYCDCLCPGFSFRRQVINSNYTDYVHRRFLFSSRLNLRKLGDCSMLGCARKAYPCVSSNKLSLSRVNTVS